MSPSVKFGIQTRTAEKPTVSDIVSNKNPFYAKSGDKSSATKNTTRVGSPSFD